MLTNRPFAYFYGIFLIGCIVLLSTLAYPRGTARSHSREGGNDTTGSGSRLPSCTLHPASANVGPLHSYYVRMRDGIRIAVDVVRPVGVPGKKYPAVLEMTRYWRGTEGRGPSDDAKRFVRNRFAYIIGDVRGTGASFGKWPYHRSRAETLDLGEITGFSAEVVFRSGQDPTVTQERSL